MLRFCGATTDERGVAFCGSAAMESESKSIDGHSTPGEQADVTHTTCVSD